MEDNHAVYEKMEFLLQSEKKGCLLQIIGAMFRGTAVDGWRVARYGLPAEMTGTSEAVKLR